MPKSPNPISLATVKKMLAAGKSVTEMRAILHCSNNRLYKFMARHGLKLSEEARALISQRIGESNRHRSSMIEPGKGGDAEFARLIGEQSFTNISCPNIDRFPIMPYRRHGIPGDDRSEIGSTFRGLAA